MNINLVKGIGPKSIEYLSKMNILNVSDLITYYPYKYNVIKVIRLNETVSGENITIKGIVETEPRINYINKSLNKMTFRVRTDDYLINVVIFNRSFYKKNLTIGRMINLLGKYDKQKNQFVASDIRFDLIKDYKIEPVYHLVNGIKRNSLMNLIKEAFAMKVDLEDYIPDYLIKKYNFVDKYTASYDMHFPDKMEDVKKAKLRLIYEEFFVFMFKMNLLKYKYDDDNTGIKRVVDFSKVEEFISSLPFNLTVDQEKAVKDIYNDLTNDRRMNRLILGDVGSGKTLVAIIGMYINYLGGYQTAMMAPTEILANQHYENIKELFKDLDIKVGLLVGATKKREKDQLYKQLEDGELDIIIGTHALISDKVIFNNLGLVITDEQHRFGVNQRSNLQNKGIKCDVLYMSATPIPRTYALTIYGDMDTSLIATKPGGRKDIITKVLKSSDIKKMLSHIWEEVKIGNQIYVVSPLIENEDGESDLKDVIKLKESFNIAFQGKVNVDILHGKMNNKDKTEVMERYKKGDIKVLISTTVIEVGVDVKKATMMVIFNADRFGLATLHQLRGRVGRNDLQSYCYLICDREVERLKVMEQSNDGFYISQKDFELRGEGDLFGTRQSGDMSFKLGDIRRDYKILLQCKNDAEVFIKDNIKSEFINYPQYENIVKKLDFID